MSIHIESRTQSRRIIKCDICDGELRDDPASPEQVVGSVSTLRHKCAECMAKEQFGPPTNRTILHKLIEAQKPQPLMVEVPTQMNHPPTFVVAGPDGKLIDLPPDKGPPRSMEDTYQALLFELLEHIDETLFDEPIDSFEMVKYAKELITDGKNMIRVKSAEVQALTRVREETFEELDATKTKNRKLERELARWSDGTATLPGEIHARAQKMGTERNWKNGNYYLTNALDAVEELERKAKEAHERAVDSEQCAMRAEAQSDEAKEQAQGHLKEIFALNQKVRDMTDELTKVSGSLETFKKIGETQSKENDELKKNISTGFCSPETLERGFGMSCARGWDQKSKSLLTQALDAVEALEKKLEEAIQKRDEDLGKGTQELYMNFKHQEFLVPNDVAERTEAFAKRRGWAIPNGYLARALDAVEELEKSLQNARYLNPPIDVQKRCLLMRTTRNWPVGDYLTSALDMVERLEKERDILKIGIEAARLERDEAKADAERAKAERNKLSNEYHEIHKKDAKIEELIKKNEGAFDIVEAAVNERDKLREDLAAANARTASLIGDHGRDYCTRIEKERDALKLDLIVVRKERAAMETRLINIGRILEG